MTDPYSVLGITPGADDETIKKAYRQKCKQYHPDLHPNDPSAEEKFKEVQAAYSEIMRRKQNGSQAGYQQQQSSGGSYGYNQNSYGNSYQGDPFGGFGFGPFGFGFYGSSGSRQTYTTGQESPELRAAANYIRNGFYQEALNTLNGIAASERNAQWHYYCALANQALVTISVPATKPGLQHPWNPTTTHTRTYWTSSRLRARLTPIISNRMRSLVVIPDVFVFLSGCTF